MLRTGATAAHTPQIAQGTRNVAQPCTALGVSIPHSAAHLPCITLVLELLATTREQSLTSQQGCPQTSQLQPNPGASTPQHHSNQTLLNHIRPCKLASPHRPLSPPGTQRGAQQMPWTLHASHVYLFTPHAVHTYTHTHMHAPSLSVPPPGPDPEPEVVLSVQCPVPWSHGSQPGASLLAPKATAPQGRLSARPRRPREPLCWLLPWMCSHNYCNHSALLGTMPLREPPPPDLNCPLALPGEREARMRVQRGACLPQSLKGPAHTPPG